MRQLKVGGDISLSRWMEENGNILELTKYWTPKLETKKNMEGVGERVWFPHSLPGLPGGSRVPAHWQVGGASQPASGGHAGLLSWAGDPRLVLGAGQAEQDPSSEQLTAESAPCLRCCPTARWCLAWAAGIHVATEKLTQFALSRDPLSSALSLLTRTERRVGA